MPAKLSIHVPGDAVLVRVIADDASLTVGRDPTCDLVVVHESVSRRHAQLAGNQAGRWVLSDLGSKNGIRIDGQREPQAQLSRHGWFAIGDVMCEFEPIDADAAANLSARSRERRHSSLAWSQRFDSGSETRDLIGNLLNGIVEVAECERGFLLTLDRDGQLRMRACYEMAPEDASRVAFTGSRSAIDRAINERRAVFLSDRRDKAWLQDQASVIAGGIRALACVPLLQDGRLLGIAYADTANEAKVFTDLDAELLSALVDHAAAALALTELDASLSDMSFWLAVNHTGMREGSGPAPTWGSVASGTHIDETAS
ncbi:MAG: GAF domain-containing protein [Dokdonella sp.]